MEKNPPIQKSNNFLIQKVTELLGIFLLEITRFGKTEHPLVWVAGPKMVQVAKLLLEDAELKMNWLENLSVAELDEGFVVSYFLRSVNTPYQLVLRVSQVLEKTKKKQADAIITLPSVKTSWPMAEPMEREIEELFGIHFKGDEDETPGEKRVNRLLPGGWEGYPLRKSFKFPETIQSIHHSREQS